MLTTSVLTPVGQVSNPVFIPSGSLVTVTPSAGGTVVVEYTQGSAADIANRTATWAAWPNGTISSATSNVTNEMMWLRITPSTKPALFSWEDQPSFAQYQPFRADWGGFYNAGNVNITGGTGLFTGVLGVDISGTPATLTNPLFQATNSTNNYTQSATQNKSAGANASADHICYPDNVAASDLTGFVDMGVCSSTFAQAAYACTGANDAYLFASAPSASGKNGNLVIWTDATGARNDISFGTNGFNSTANERMRIKKGGQVKFIPLAAAPVDAVEEGDMYYNSTLHKLQIRTAAAWETITSV